MKRLEREDIYEENYHYLACAIIERLVHDYKKWFRMAKKYPKSKEAKENIL